MSSCSPRSTTVGRRLKGKLDLAIYTTKLFRHLVPRGVAFNSHSNATPERI